MIVRACFCFFQCRDFKLGCAAACKIRERLWILIFGKSHWGKMKGEISIYEKETDKDSLKFLKIKRMSDQEYLEDELLLTKESLRK